MPTAIATRIVATIERTIDVPTPRFKFSLDKQNPDDNAKNAIIPMIINTNVTINNLR